MHDWKLQPARDLGLPLSQRLRSTHRESGTGELLAQLAWWGAARSYLKLAHRVDVIGQANLPKVPPFVLIANHSSHLDALVLATALPGRLRGCVFPIVAGDTFFETPAVSLFAATMLNALPLWRKRAGRHEMADLRERLTGGSCVFILFPEGTRSRDGAMGRFKPGLGMLVAGTNVPVVPCHLEGAFSAMPPGSNWPRAGQRVRARIGTPQTYGDELESRQGWERIAADAERRVRTLSPDAPVSTTDQ